MSHFHLIYKSVSFPKQLNVFQWTVSRDFFSHKSTPSRLLRKFTKLVLQIFSFSMRYSLSALLFYLVLQISSCPSLCYSPLCLTVFHILLSLSSCPHCATHLSTPPPLPHQRPPWEVKIHKGSLKLAPPLPQVTSCSCPQGS